MAKRSIKFTLETKDNTIANNVIGVFIDNSIKYKDGNVFVVIKNNNDEIIFTRENNEYKLELLFKNNSNTFGTYLLKEYNKLIELNIYTSVLKITDKYIEIEYELNDEKRYYKLEIGEVV